MVAYRKFSERWSPTPERRDQGCPPPKAPKPPKAVTEPEPDTLGALDGLGGVLANFRKSDVAADSPSTSAALAPLAGMPLSGSKAVGAEAVEQIENHSS